MYRQVILSLLFIFAATGCTPRYADYFPYLDDGTQKPYIAFVPMGDASGFGQDLEEELTDSICKEMMYNGDLYLFPENKVKNMMASAGDVDYFGKDLSFAKQFQGAEFIVITELIEHQIVSRDEVRSVSKLACGPGSNFVALKVRLRVIDCRYATPRVAMQEIVESYQPVNYNTVCNPGASKGYTQAHKNLVDQIVFRLERVIWSCR